MLPLEYQAIVSIYVSLLNYFLLGIESVDNLRQSSRQYQRVCELMKFAKKVGCEVSLSISGKHEHHDTFCTQLWAWWRNRGTAGLLLRLWLETVQEYLWKLAMKPYMIIFFKIILSLNPQKNDFQSHFSVESFWFFGMKNVRLGDQLLLMTFLKNLVLKYFLTLFFKNVYL